MHLHFSSFFFFFNDTATTEIYTLSLHDALPISLLRAVQAASGSTALRWQGHSADAEENWQRLSVAEAFADRKSTRLNSSHGYISYAVFCLKKKKKIMIHRLSTYTHTTPITTMYT